MLIIAVWLTTMAGLNANKQKEENNMASFYATFLSCKNLIIEDKLQPNCHKIIFFV